MAGNPSFEGLRRFGRRAKRVGLAAGTALLLGCPADDATPDVTPIELPPPLVGESRLTDRPPAEPVDADDWQLPESIAAPAATIYVSQDNRGELQACGCPGSPTGGFARRQTLVGRIRSKLPGALILEGPNALSRSIAGVDVVTPEQRARGRKVLDLLVATGPDAFFPGHADFVAVAPADLAKAARAAQLPLVATNLDPSVPGYLRSWERTVDDRRLLFLNLLGTPANEEGRRRAPLLEASGTAASVVAAASEIGRPDAVIAFTDGDLRDVGRWLEDGLDVDVLVTSPRPGDDEVFRWRDGTLVVRSEPLGRAFRRIDLLLGGTRGSGLRGPGKHQWLPERLAAAETQYLRQLRKLLALPADAAGGDASPQAPGQEAADPSKDPAQLRAALASLKAERRKLRTRMGQEGVGNEAWVSDQVIHSDLQQDPGVEQAVAAYAGQWLARIATDVVSTAAPDERYASKDACVDCHPSELATWSRTKHASAWAPLQKRGSTRDPECLACHTTGFGDPGGFVDPEQDRTLLGVQCEACHGPMDEHVQAARKTPRFKPPAPPPVSEATCAGCHDEANSPKFDYASYRPRVSHRKAATGSP